MVTTCKQQSEKTTTTKFVMNGFFLDWTFVLIKKTDNKMTVCANHSLWNQSKSFFFFFGILFLSKHGSSID